MLTTENFARTQWCPMARQEGDQATYNRWQKGEQGNNCNCIASACMAWRWADPVPVKVVAGEYWPEGPDWNHDEGLEKMMGQGEPPRPSHVSAEAVWVPLTQDEHGNFEGGLWTDTPEYIAALNNSAQEGRRGYCGAFGKPEHA